MSKSIWDRFAPIYSFAMKSQKNIHDYMYSHIREKVADASKQYKNFLESNGWKITASEVVPGRIDLMYVELIKK